MRFSASLASSAGPPEPGLAPEVALDPLLIEILVCPEDKLPLWYIPGEEILYNPRLFRQYPMRGNIPVLLVAEAEAVTSEDHERIARAHDDHGITTGSPPSS